MAGWQSWKLARNRALSWVLRNEERGFQADGAGEGLSDEGNSRHRTNPACVDHELFCVPRGGRRWQEASGDIQVQIPSALQFGTSLWQVQKTEAGEGTTGREGHQVLEGAPGLQWSRW